MGRGANNTYDSYDMWKENGQLEEKLNSLKAEAIVKIETLENEDYKTILIKRYIEGCKWEEIANLIYVSKSTVKRWHKEALHSLNFS